MLLIYNDFKNIISESLKKIINNGNENEIDIIRIFNLNDIPIDEIRYQYRDLSFTVSSSGYGGRFMGNNGQIINEDINSTLSIDETKNEIQSKFKFKDWQFTTQMGANGIELIVLYPGIFKNTSLIKSAMEACGWSVSTKGWAVFNHMLWRAISFDPMFQDDIYNEALKHNFLYHWTPLYNYEQIMKEGLKPRSENKLFDYPDRLHLLKGNTPQDEILKIGNLLYQNNKNKKNNGQYVLLQIKVSMLNNVEIFYDPRYEWGYYVKNNIPSNIIKPLFGFDFKNSEIIKV